MQPTLTTERLILRPFTLSDAPDVHRLAGEYQIALNTARVPHPFPPGHAEEWISTHATGYAAGELVSFAICLRDTEILVGAIGLTVVSAHRRAELGYWIGGAFTGQGYCTEAAQAVIAFGFSHFDVQRIEAECFARNVASGRVLQKLGMRLEGVLRQHFVKWNEPQDVCHYGLLRSEWQ